MTILEAIGEPALLEQLAEESTELAQAALKLSRILRHENPTPVTQEQAVTNLIEEIADVRLVMSEWIYGHDYGIEYRIVDIRRRKLERWRSRLEAANEQTAETTSGKENG